MEFLRAVERGVLTPTECRLARALRLAARQTVRSWMISLHRLDAQWTAAFLVARYAAARCAQITNDERPPLRSSRQDGEDRVLLQPRTIAMLMEQYCGSTLMRVGSERHVNTISILEIRRRGWGKASTNGDAQRVKAVMFHAVRCGMMFHAEANQRAMIIYTASNAMPRLE